MGLPSSCGRVMGSTVLLTKWRKTLSVTFSVTFCTDLCRLTCWMPCSSEISYSISRKVISSYYYYYSSSYYSLAVCSVVCIWSQRFPCDWFLLWPHFHSVSDISGRFPVVLGRIDGRWALGQCKLDGGYMWNLPPPLLRKRP